MGSFNLCSNFIALGAFNIFSLKNLSRTIANKMKRKIASDESLFRSFEKKEKSRGSHKFLIHFLFYFTLRISMNQKLISFDNRYDALESIETLYRIHLFITYFQITKLPWNIWYLSRFFRILFILNMNHEIMFGMICLLFVMNYS